MFSYFLMALEPGSGRISITPFRQMQLELATTEYARVEREVTKAPGGEAVLVAVEQLEQLRRAYPNYFLDTTAFLQEVARATA